MEKIEKILRFAKEASVLLLGIIFLMLSFINLNYSFTIYLMYGIFYNLTITFFVVFAIIGAVCLSVYKRILDKNKQNLININSIL